MRLANITESTSPILSSKPSPSFTILLIVQYELHNIKVSALLDSGALACFIDKDFIKCHKLPLVTKKYVVFVEVIDDRSLASGNIIHEMQSLDIFVHRHRSTVIFNVIQSLSNHVILDLFWLDRYNP